MNSQTSCSSNGSLRTCNLGGSHTLNYETDPKDIPFTLRSHRRGNAWSYYLEILPLNGNTFSLVSDNGEQIDISITFTSNGGITEVLNPGVLAGSFGGTTTDTGAFLSIEVDGSLTPSSSRYSGNFQMELSQYFLIFPIDTETIEFDIVLEVEPNITIRNLGDIDLSNSGITLGQIIKGSEDFCVGGIGFSNYTVNLSSSNGSTGGGGSSGYELGGSSENIPYTVTFSDDLTGTSGIAPGGLGDVPGSFSRRTDESCISDNARIYISVSPSDWENANEPFYTDVLTVTVSSQ
ncbi:hypothetical protein ACJJIG_04230 [Microbulbifer sp. SSSA007]|uniref:hypothetical protein n=1 Tax=Microbulbifer sp. SSSA007 TaxID=3243379 RepID=UPI004039FF07